MSSSSSRFGAIFLLLIVSALFMTFWDEARTRMIVNSSLHTTAQQHSQSIGKRYAYATLLHGPAEVEDDDGSFEKDSYFMATRVLAYQLLHSNISTTADIPFLVLVTEAVTQEKQARLREDGATVIVVDKIDAPAWMHAASGRWLEMLTKLHIFELTDYDKVCYMDSDILVVENLDGVFEDEATNPRMTTREHVVSDEPAMPPQYVLAAHSDNYAYDHPYPPDQERDYLNAGFLVIQPSKELFDYYVVISKIKDRFLADAMEQNLLNYVHRWSGDMPWQRLWYGWNTNFATFKDYEGGTKSFHDKYWGGNAASDAVLCKMWQEQRRKMEEHWRR
ncbi:hypothetical protein AMS68_006440 [Peltaster fructicola]|uniref:Glycosyltransferase family 8 protein n=1 Tax=Peltaster fructicola TaxID=286661 RepID=A0A6H0Y1P1_9PEZI|nr:hypothetical protein AMS68_006440 [Peltaster fructicola]